MELHENKPESNSSVTDMFLNGTEINMSSQLKASKVPKQEYDTTNKKTTFTVIFLLWKMLSRIFYSEIAFHMLNTTRRETYITELSVSQLPKESYKLKDAHQRVLGAEIIDLNENTDTKLYQVRHRRDSFSTSRKDDISEHSKPQLESENSTAANTTFFRRLIRKVTLEAEVKHSAQVAFLCLAGLCCLMTWTIWYNGMCRNRTLKYVYWDRQKTVTTDIRDILYRRRKYLPLFQEEQCDVVYVEDRGTDP